MLGTIDNANEAAMVGVDALFSNPKFASRHDRAKLEQEIRMATIKKLVTEDTDILSEEEFIECCKAARTDLLVH